MLLKQISDKEFLTSFLNFNFAARPAISFILSESLTKDTSLKQNDKRVIYLEILENYLFESEIALMLLYSFHEKKINPAKSLASIYNSTFIKEGEKQQHSLKLLEILKDFSDEELLNYFDLQSPPELMANFKEETIKESTLIWGSIESAIEQARTELSNLRESLSKIVHNRIFNLDGDPVPLYQLLNKLKHGYQVIPDPTEDLIYALLSVQNSDATSTVFEVMAIPYSEANANWFSEQTKYMAEVIRHLIMWYSFNL